jgi:hypothetical protein
MLWTWREECGRKRVEKDKKVVDTEKKKDKLTT